MSLNYRLEDVKHSEHFTRLEDGTIEWGRWTESLIFMTMHVDMGEITEKNYREFYRRWKMLELVKGYRDTYKDLTLEVVKAHIGLSTNVYTTTAAAWKKRVMGALEEVVYEAIRREERANA